MLFSNEEDLAEIFNDDVRPMNVLREGQLEQEPIGVDNDDQLSVESGEVLSDDEEFNTRRLGRPQGEANFEFVNYKRVMFRFLDFAKESIYRGLSALLSSSPAMLYRPNDTKNLLFRPPSIPSSQTVLTREMHRDFLTSLISFETVCDLSESFTAYPLMTRNIEWSRELRDVVQGSELREFEICFQTGTNAYKEYQRNCNYGMWLMHLPATSGTPSVHFKLSDDAVERNCVLIVTKAFYYVKNLIIRGNRPSIWPDIQGRQIGQTETMIKIRSPAYLVGTLENHQVVASLLQHETVSLTYVGPLSQYLKALRIVSIPPRPLNVAAHQDYNVCPLYDGVINPQTYNTGIYDGLQTLNQKFYRLMESNDLGILLVEGAPGTGKTSTVVKTVVDYINDAKSHSRKLPRILVSAPSNAAADVFYLKLHDELSGVSVCRYGEYWRFNSQVQVKCKSDLRRYQFGQASDPLDTNPKQKEELTAKQKFILDATIIVVTMGSSQTGDLINLRHRLSFDLLIVDECGQAKIEEFLFPLYFTSIHRLLLIGDPRQLGPILKSAVASELPMEQTCIFVKLFNYLDRNAPNAIFRLREQHRMRTVVASMVSAISYTDTDRLTTNQYGNWLRTTNHPALLIFSDYSWSQKRAKNSSSYENIREAQFVIALLCASLRRQEFNFDYKCFPRDRKLTYVIIALYRGQVSLINRLLLEAGLDKIVKVATVDQMQGSECDIAIISAVRASSQFGVGFASDLRRLNVALSRAACVYVLAKHLDFHTRQGWSTLFHEASRINCVYTKAGQILRDGKLDEILASHAQEEECELNLIRPV